MLIGLSIALGYYIGFFITYYIALHWFTSNTTSKGSFEEQSEGVIKFAIFWPIVLPLAILLLIFIGPAVKIKSIISYNRYGKKEGEKRWSLFAKHS